MKELKMPKNASDLNKLQISLQIYYDNRNINGGWTDNASYIDAAKVLLNDGVTHEPQFYTKMMQVNTYFGFIEWQSHTSTSQRRITDSGIRFYEALISDDQATKVIILVEALSSVLFGRNNNGVPDSNSDIEAPCLFIRAALTLSYLTVKEFALMLWHMDFEGVSYSDTLNIISDKRSNGDAIEVPSEVQKFEDCKPITALVNWGILTSDSGRISVNREVKSLYFDYLKVLSIYNIDKHKLTIKQKTKTKNHEVESLQMIYFGAPGTGKSHFIKGITAESDNKITTTFHPDTDYASFVGCYKPQVEDDGKTITYKFTPQVFAKAYVSAWRLLLGEPIKDSDDKKFYLVIEEINRGNCAQIFGDIFQLLDRNEDGFSDYVIDVDKDFADYLLEELAGLNGYKDRICALAGIENTNQFTYSKIALPCNLSILATMNTSDQSLFPMDSAFKRRWEWKYVPINSTDVSYANIVVDNKKYSWSSFIDNINEKIINTCKSEDKQLGPFFIKVSKEKPDIDWKLFRSKVMSFLWFDVYKDLYESDENTVFRYYQDDKKEESVEFSFGKLFYGDDKAQITLLQRFMEYIINEE